MGTGSHRPQWEAAKGREDARTGIKHARSLPSHTQLKYRRAVVPMRATPHKGIEAAKSALESSQRTINTDAKTELGPNFPRGGSGDSNGAEKPVNTGGSVGGSASGSENDSRGAVDPETDDDSSDDEAELRRELDLINKRRALQAQRDAKRNPAPVKTSAWRSEATFKRKPTAKRGSDMLNDALQKAEHREFLDKYLK